MEEKVECLWSGTSSTEYVDLDRTMLNVTFTRESCDSGNRSQCRTTQKRQDC